MISVRRGSLSGFFTFITLLLITNCYSSQPAYGQQTEKNEQQTQTVTSTAGEMASFSVSNISDSIVRFTFTVNDKLWFSPDEMLGYIRNLSCDTLPGTGQLISSAFSFVVNHTGHRCELPLANNFSYSPGYFVNSIGYGLCSNRAAVLSNILIKLGYKSRCVQLGGAFGL
ncbi:MAG TPA: hypothetical protein PLK75_02930 [Bacteroidales bacterium]|nr:hypothetical protein [Bacteroidales bacterium]